jgi:hypothetical protein
MTDGEGRIGSGSSPYREDGNEGGGDWVERDSESSQIWVDLGFGASTSIPLVHQNLLLTKTLSKQSREVSKNRLNSSLKLCQQGTHREWPLVLP